MREQQGGKICQIAAEHIHGIKIRIVFIVDAIPRFSTTDYYACSLRLHRDKQEMMFQKRFKKSVNCAIFQSFDIQILIWYLQLNFLTNK